MSIARTGALPDSYKYITLAIDGFEGRLLKGRMYHDTQEEAMVFGCISEMALQLESLFDGMHYPMKSVDQRSFSKKNRHGSDQGGVLRTGAADQEIRGDLAEYRLHVKYRFHATWQGEITDLRSADVFCFSSFLELMEYLDHSLGSVRRDGVNGLGKRMCEVAVRSFDGLVMAGDVSHPAVEQRREFACEFELKEEIEHMLLPLPEGEEGSGPIIPRSVMVNTGSFGPMTFVVRILFKRNATWQGTVSWKEKRAQVSFRSFLEMLLIMQAAAAANGGWAEELQAASGHIG